MSVFTNCEISPHIKDSGKPEYEGIYHQYTYRRDNKDYIIASGMLNSLFETYGYCVDPGARTPVPLTKENIEKLSILATEHGDHYLLNTINSISKAKIPSPRMVNDALMHETTLNEKTRFDRLTALNQKQTIVLLKNILNIGMYLAGWKGNEEPYITMPREVCDTVRVELKVLPLIESVYTNPNYLQVKNFPIMGYFRQKNLNMQAVSIKPFIINNKLNVDHCLGQIYLGVSQNEEMNNISLKQLASHLISTSYYYITSICRTPLPMVQPLIHNLSLL